MTLGKSTSDPRTRQVVASHENHVAGIHIFEEVLLRDRAKLIEFGLFAQQGSIGDFCLAGSKASEFCSSAAVLIKGLLILTLCSSFLEF